MHNMKRSIVTMLNATAQGHWATSLPCRPRHRPSLGFFTFLNRISGAIQHYLPRGPRFLSFTNVLSDIMSLNILGASSKWSQAVFMALMLKHIPPHHLSPSSVTFSSAHIEDLISSPRLPLL